MDLFFDNPIANLYGPQFLVFFAVVCLVGIIWARRRVRTDATSDLPVPSVPPDVDPREVAYLRGGHAEVVRLVIFDLIQRKYLAYREPVGTSSPLNKPRIDQAAEHPSKKYLDGMERAIFDWMRSGKSVSEIMPALPDHLEKQNSTEALKRSLEQRQMIASEGMRTAAKKAVRPVAWIILALAAYKIVVALNRGRPNIWFLVILTFLALIILVCAAQPPRLTALGRAYFDKVQQMFSSLRTRGVPAVSGAADAYLVMTAAVFGIAVLEGTSYGFYPTMFKKGTTDTSGSSCGSSCGSSSSCSSGSSCGGGCGGGGCGGCGS